MLQFVRVSSALVRGLFHLASAPVVGALHGAPPPLGGGRSAGPASCVRKSLRASCAEGVFAELFTACAGPTVLTGWALHLGATPLEVGFVAALPQLAQAVQLPGAWATALFGRRRVALVTITLSRQALLPLALLPFLPLGNGAARALLVAAAALSAALSVAGNNAWTSWMGELVPERLRGRYFGRRTAVCTVFGTAGGLLAARILDAASSARATELVLAALALAASAAGWTTTALLARQHEPGAPPPRAPSLRDALRPLADPRARDLLWYLLAWNASVGLAGGYFTFHLLHNLRAGYTLVALHASLVASARVVSAPLWGRAIDRYGAAPVLAACSFAAAGLPLLWLATSDRVLWPIAIDAAVGGVAWGGHALASFAVPLDLSPRRERPFYVAVAAMAGGVAYAAATSVGGVLASAAPRVAPALVGAAHGLEPVFALSAAGRLASAFLAVRIAGGGAAALGELHRSATRGALALVRAPFRR
jgi:MFS family permease